MPIELDEQAEAIRGQIEEYVDEIFVLVAQVEDGVERLKLQTEAIDVLRESGFQLSEQRRENAYELNQEGLSYAQLADILDVSRGRIQQLITGIASPKRAGVIETDVRVEAAQMRAAGVKDRDIVKELVPKIRHRRSGGRLTRAQIADMLTVDESMVTPVLDKVDAKMRKEKFEERVVERV